MAQLDTKQLVQHLLLVVDAQFSAAERRDAELLTRFEEQQDQLSKILNEPTRGSAKRNGLQVERPACAAPVTLEVDWSVTKRQVTPVNEEPSSPKSGSPRSPVRANGGAPMTSTLSTKSKFHFKKKEFDSDGYGGRFAWQLSAARIVSHHHFELLVASVIMANALVVCFEGQYTGIQVGYDLAYKNYGVPAHEAWPGASTVFDVFDWIFGVVFFFEVVVKFSAWSFHYFLEPWNILDFACVLAFMVDKIASGIVASPPQALRLLRLFRLMRLVRLLRTLENMDVLYIMVTAIKDMTMILVSAVALLSVMLMACSLFLTQIMHSTYFKGVDTSTLSPAALGKHQELFEYFGTMSRCMLSMFELTLGNWPPVTRLLSEEVTEWFMLICIAHKLTIGFAVVGVINGVILQETFKVAATDDMIMVRQKKRSKEMLHRKMLTLLEALDHSDDGMLDYSEFEIIACQPDVKLWLASMDIETDDLKTLFKLIDEDNSGFVSPEELTQQIGRLKGTARSIDVLTLKENVKSLIDHLMLSPGAQMKQRSSEKYLA